MKKTKKQMVFFKKREAGCFSIKKHRFGKKQRKRTRLPEA